MNMASEPENKMTLYSFVGSQWAGVAHLALAEKGFEKSDFDIKETDLVLAENFHPEYIALNPNGTIPILTSPSLPKPLIKSRDILECLDSLRPNPPHLIPQDPVTNARVQQIINLVHSSKVDTNLILLHARNESEMEAKKLSVWNSFILNRQAELEKNHTLFPGHPFYGPKALENETLYKLYTTKVGPAHQKFFAQTEKMWIDFAAGVKELDDLLVLPYAAGDEVTAADLHVVPWLSHALWGAGATGVKDFEALERLVGKTVKGFEFGPRVKGWWGNIGEREAFKEVYETLH